MTPEQDAEMTRIVNALLEHANTLGQMADDPEWKEHEARLIGAFPLVFQAWQKLGPIIGERLVEPEYDRKIDQLAQRLLDIESELMGHQWFDGAKETRAIGIRALISNASTGLRELIDRE